MKPFDEKEKKDILQDIVNIMNKELINLRPLEFHKDRVKEYILMGKHWEDVGDDI